MYFFLYKFILHAPLQECNTTCNGVFLNNKQYHTLTINYLFYIQDGSINTNNDIVVLYSLSEFINMWK